MNKGYSIGEVSKLLNLTPYTLRYYEKEGIISIPRKENGLREFSEMDLDILKILVCLKETNMSIKNMKKFMDVYRNEEDSIKGKQEILNMQKKHLNSEIAKLQKYLDRANYEIWYYKNIDKYGDKNDPNHCNVMKEIYDDLLL